MGMRTVLGAGALMLALGFLPRIAVAAPDVVVTIKPVHSLVAQVMDGVGTPRLLLDASASPHAYALRPSEARAVAGADLVVRVSADLETFLVDVLQDRPVLTFDTLPGVTLLKWDEGDAHGHGHGHDHAKAREDGHEHGGHGKHDHDEEEAGSHAAHHHAGDHDTHVWLDPVNAAVLVRATAGTLSRLDPANAPRYAANAERAVGSLSALEAQVNARLAPVRGQPYVVFHDAYSYFENRFRLPAGEVLSLNPETAPGARHVARIRAEIVAEDIRCVFAEPQFRPALVETVIEGTPARAAVLDPLGAALPAGPAAYGTLILGLADSMAECLAR
ncbi:MAG: zinc ABC transporter substrate-binding protein [Pseudomonadota bacterium]|nr:zinc ABC transporter substrate-binding protein [Pseudomonadota bacterium]